MANKETKRFDNVLGKLHGSKPSETTINTSKAEKTITVPSKKKKESNRKRITFFVDEVLEDYIDKGTLHEMYRSKSDFVEYILKEYFKGKPYLKK
ncbi:hypothetical protein [Pontibacter fetidus]|uniref:Uncharacterized protein n=1 Tax=Pontibacter fetidus TaxID=2700082 RepID=A0A6B2H8G7_9BACT|nr:hypothetical protein [Pontibacter fetidus]NDK57356.1 hypothetical protein [Pontibacter fetidus]